MRPQDVGCLRAIAIAGALALTMILATGLISRAGATASRGVPGACKVITLKNVNQVFGHPGTGPTYANGTCNYGEVFLSFATTSVLPWAKAQKEDAGSTVKGYVVPAFTFRSRIGGKLWTELALLDNRDNGDLEIFIRAEDQLVAHEQAIGRDFVTQF